MSAALQELSRPIYEVPLQASHDIGKRGEMKWIAIEKLFVDESYQRPVAQEGKRNIRRIVENFHFSLFSPIVVAPRGKGRYAVIDGQHRAIAAALHGGIDELPALVLKCSEADEARAFHTINGTITRVNIQYLFRARVAAKDPTAVAAVEACTAAGARIMPYPVQSSQLKAGETLAAGTIEKCLARYGREVLVRAIEMVTRTGGGNVGLLVQALIVGGCVALERHPKWLKHKDLLAAVDKAGVGSLRAKALQAAAEFGGAISAQYANALGEVLKAELGDGGTPAVLETRAERERREARATHARNMAKATGGGTRKKPASLPSKKLSANDKDAIAKFIAEKGVRRFDDPSATGDTGHLLDWLEREAKMKVRRLQLARASAGKIYEIEGRKYNLDGLIRIVDRERRKRGLEPIMREAA